MKSILPILSLGLVLLAAISCSKSTSVNSTRTTSSKATRADVLQYFYNIVGKSTITGQHNREPNSDPTKWTRVVHDITGVNPGLWGGDFLFLPDDVQNRQSMIDEAIRQWNAGSMVALTWHVCPPNIGETCDWNESGILSSLNDNQWNELITEGSDFNNLWKARLDTIVPYLRQLKDNGVIAIWRPIHEMNEGWSWWGGRPGSNGSRKLYQLTHDYLTKYHGFDNLIWTWCVKDTQMNLIGEYYPGGDYVDIASLDIWVNRYPTDTDYNLMLQVAQGKPIALAEVGSVPTPDILQRQNQWVWFMVWAEYLKDPSFNTDQGVKDTYYLPNALHQGDINIGDGGGDTNLALGHPIKSSSQESSALSPEKTVDGDLSTRWSSEVTPQEQWIYVDLGSNVQIRVVKLSWEDAFAKGYQVQTSTDEVGWDTVYENYNGAGGVETITLSQAVTARFVKLYLFQHGTEFGYSLFEIEVYS